MLGRRTLIGLTSPDVRTVPGETSRVTAHTRAPESAAAMVTAPATIEPITSKTPATRRKSNQLGVFTRRGEGEVVATCLGPVSARSCVGDEYATRLEDADRRMARRSGDGARCRGRSATSGAEGHAPRSRRRDANSEPPGRDQRHSAPTCHCKTSPNVVTLRLAIGRPEQAKRHVIPRIARPRAERTWFLNVTDRRDPSLWTNRAPGKHSVDNARPRKRQTRHTRPVRRRRSADEGKRRSWQRIA